MHDFLERLGLTGDLPGAGTGEWQGGGGETLESFSPIDGKIIGTIKTASSEDYEKVAATADQAFKEWRKVPAPKRGEIVRQIGHALRDAKDDLGALVSLEVGKILDEGKGEVQEMIDIADFAVGQSRMLYGLSMHSERPDHRMYEQWHPLGTVGVITAFNFPAAVWSWNALLALICGDCVIWKPSSKAPLTAVAIMKVAWKVLKENGVPEGVLGLAIGGRDAVGEAMLADKRMPLISATGSVAMGKKVGQAVAARLGRSLLELGGNNGIIITPEADLKMAVMAVLFGAVGTAGQRCTSTRRLMVHEDIYDKFASALTKAYSKVRIGNPLEAGTLMGPLVDKGAVDDMQNALKNLKDQGGKILYGGEVLSGGLFDAGTYVSPCIAEAGPEYEVVHEETFAPIVYLIKYKTIDEAIGYHNTVPQGLSSAIFTLNMREAETFLSNRGSDCGIANVNIGTSGAEIGGAFGGEKETGGGRESGSDAWKVYMRRQTNTINWSPELPLAQGISFDLD